MLAGFGKSGVIEQKDPVGVGQPFGQGGPVLAGHGPLIPTALAHELLEGLFGVFDGGQVGRQAHPARDGFNRFAFAFLEQAVQVDLGPIGLAGAVKVGVETVGVRLEPLEHRRLELRRESAVHSTPLITRINVVASRLILTE